MNELLDEFEDIACAAGCLIKSLRADGKGWSLKADGSPVTEADKFADELIIERLTKIADGCPIVTEEWEASHTASDIGMSRFFLVDPLDGTKEYIKGARDYTVNIALIEAGTPVAGVVVAPERSTSYSGAAGSAHRAGFGADGRRQARTQIRVREAPEELVAVVSASHLDAETQAFLESMGITRRASIGSSLKFCLLACGEADIYPRFGRTMQWDTAAGDAVLRNAGGALVTPGGRGPAYGMKHAGSDHPFSNQRFVAYSTPALLPRIVRSVDIGG